MGKVEQQKAGGEGALTAKPLKCINKTAWKSRNPFYTKPKQKKTQLAPRKPKPKPPSKGRRPFGRNPSSKSA